MLNEQQEAPDAGTPRARAIGLISLGHVKALEEAGLAITTQEQADDLRKVEAARWFTMELKDGHFDAKMSDEYATAWCAVWADFFKRRGGPNCLESTLTGPAVWEVAPDGLLLTLQRRNGKSPLELRNEAVEALRTIRQKATAWMEDDRAGYDAATDCIIEIEKAAASLLSTVPCKTCADGKQLDAEIECESCGRVGAP